MSVATIATGSAVPPMDITVDTLTASEVTAASVAASEVTASEVTAVNITCETIVSTGGSLPSAIINVTSAAQLAGVLDSAKVYFIDGVVDLGGLSIIVPPTGLTLKGHGFGISSLQSSDAGHTCFTTDGTFSGSLCITAIDIACVGAGSQVFNLDNAGNSNAVEWNGVNFSQCTSLGELSNYRQGLAHNIGWVGCGDGLTMSGVWSGFAAVDSIVVAGLTGTLFKAGAGLVVGESFRSNINILGIGAGVFCDFAPANITLDGGFSLTGVRALVGSTTVPNMPATSTRADIRNCKGIGNTYPGATYIPASNTGIPLPLVDTLYQITGTGSLVGAYWFSGANFNGIQSDSASPIEVECIGALSFVGSSNRLIGLQLRRYNALTSDYTNIGPEYLATLNEGTGGTRAEGVAFTGVTTMRQNDRVEVWVVNRTDSSTITILQGGSFRVGER